MLKFTYDDRDYELKMTRAGASDAEAQGLTTSMISEKPFMAANLLFFAALARYKVSPRKAANILDDLLDRGEVEFKDLYEELSNAYVELFGLGESEKE